MEEKNNYSKKEVSRKRVFWFFVVIDLLLFIYLVFQLIEIFTNI
ncbi:MAG: hypothetical protein VB015_00505 [Erysipelotrichaceae bacterium]|nr:hypothetical protein [Erysipelotrichaceae bacterium]